MTRIFLPIILAISLLINYYVILNKKHNLIVENSQKIDLILNEQFEQTSKTLTEIGLRIYNENPQLNLGLIHKIFIESTSKYSTDLYSWTLFDWVDINGNQTINTRIGVRKEYLKVSNRNYSGRNNLIWSLIFSKVDLGNVSNVLIIPIGMQVSTPKFPRAGTIVIGIDLEKLSNFINSKINKNIHFAIIDSRDDSFVCGSRDAEKYFDNISFKKLDFINDRLVFSKEMEEKYPYKILVKYDENKFWQRVIFLSVAILTTFIAILILMFLKKKK